MTKPTERKVLLVINCPIELYESLLFIKKVKKKDPREFISSSINKFLLNNLNKVYEKYFQPRFKEIQKYTEEIVKNEEELIEKEEEVNKFNKTYDPLKEEELDKKNKLEHELREIKEKLRINKKIKHFIEVEIYKKKEYLDKNKKQLEEGGI